MPNTYFQFKQFIVHQQHCAMKVCTDACLFGAWVAEEVCNQPVEVNTILDIGAGTGLLSLMLAQKTKTVIDAVEMDEPAAQQATHNFASSPYKNRLQLIEGDIRRIYFEKKYGLIISNPPFFENSLTSPDRQRNLAMHSEGLGLDELILIAKNNLTGDGMLALLLPYSRADECRQIADMHGFYLSKELRVRQTTQHSPFRSMFLFIAKETIVHSSEISIRHGNEYTAEFIELMKDYYLHL